jgi:hypothetical protein
VAHVGSYALRKGLLVISAVRQPEHQTLDSANQEWKAAPSSHQGIGGCEKEVGPRSIPGMRNTDRCDAAPSLGETPSRAVHAEQLVQ